MNLGKDFINTHIVGVSSLCKYQSCIKCSSKVRVEVVENMQGAQVLLVDYFSALMIHLLSRSLSKILILKVRSGHLIRSSEK